MKQGRILGVAIALISLIGFGGLASSVAQQGVNRDRMRQQQVEELTELIRDYEQFVESRRARVEAGVGQSIDVAQSQFELTCVRADLAEAVGNRREQVAQLRGAVSMAERLLELRIGEARDPTHHDDDWASVVAARRALVEIRQELIELLGSD